MGIEIKKYNIICKENVYFIFYSIITTLLIGFGHFFCNINRFITSIALIVVAAVLYLCIVFTISKKNWLDIRAIFHAVWVFTIGLPAFQLTDYQEKWQIKTWYCLALAYFMFQIGAHSGIVFGDLLLKKLKTSEINLILGKYDLS